MCATNNEKDKIIENKKYDRMIEIDDATPEMIREFNEDRERYCKLEQKMEYKGTTIRIPYSDEVCALLYLQFKNPCEISPEEIPYPDRLSLIFGKIPMDIYLDKGDNSPLIKLSKYDYMSGNDFDYTCGKRIDDIHVFTKPKGNIVENINPKIFFI